MYFLALGKEIYSSDDTEIYDNLKKAVCIYGTCELLYCVY